MGNDRDWLDLKGEQTEPELEDWGALINPPGKGYPGDPPSRRRRSMVRKEEWGFEVVS